MTTLPPGVGLHWHSAPVVYSPKQMRPCSDCGRPAMLSDPSTGLPRHKVCAELALVRTLGLAGALQHVADYWAAHRKAEREGAR